MKVIRLALHWQMVIALVLGSLLGYLFSDCYGVWGNVINGFGNMFLHAINMVVIPLVFLSTVLSVSTMSDSRSMGRIAIKTFLYFVITALVAAIVGIVVTDSLRPGYGTIRIEADAGIVLEAAYAADSMSVVDKIVDIVPSNIFKAFVSGDILPVILFSILLGYFITKVHGERQNTINVFFQSFNDVIMAITSFIIQFAPMGIFAVVMVMVGKQANDVGSLKACVKNFAFFVIVVWISLIIVGGIVLPVMIGFIAKISPVRHLKQIYSALMVAFSTSSSYSALPLMLNDAKDKLGISNNIVAFTIPLGITFNKIGTVVYECVAVIFVSQAVGADFTFLQQMSLVGVSIITVLGAPSVPMAGVIVLAILLKSMGLPADYIGMFMAIDILCDMPKTLLNAYSASCSAVIVARSEGEILKI